MYTLNCLNDMMLLESFLYYQPIETKDSTFDEKLIGLSCNIKTRKLEGFQIPKDNTWYVLGCNYHTGKLVKSGDLTERTQEEREAILRKFYEDLIRE